MQIQHTHFFQGEDLIFHLEIDDIAWYPITEDIFYPGSNYGHQTKITGRCIDSYKISINKIMNEDDKEINLSATDTASLILEFSNNEDVIELIREGE